MGKRFRTLLLIAVGLLVSQTVTACVLFDRGWGKEYTPVRYFSDFAWTEDGKELYFIFGYSEGTELYRWTEQTGSQRIMGVESPPPFRFVDAHAGKVLISGARAELIDWSSGTMQITKIADVGICGMQAAFLDTDRFLVTQGTERKGPFGQCSENLGIVDKTGAQIATIATNASEFLLSPDRRHVLFQDIGGGDRDTNENDIGYDSIILDLLTSQRRQIAYTRDRYSIKGLVDNRHFLFSGFSTSQNQNRYSDLYLHELETGEDRLLLTGITATRAKLTADGKRLGLLVIVDNSENPWALASMNLDGSDFKIHVTINPFPKGRYP